MDGWWQVGEFENTGRTGLEKGGRDLQQKRLKLRTRNRGQESQQHRRVTATVLEERGEGCCESRNSEEQRLQEGERQPERQWLERYAENQEEVPRQVL